MITTVNSCLPILPLFCYPVLEKHPYRRIIQFWVIIIVIIIIINIIITLQEQ